MRTSLASCLFWRNSSNKKAQLILIFVSDFFLGFYQQCNLKRHMASHNTPQDGAEGFKCSHCFASFTTKSGAKYLGFFLLSFPQNERKIYKLRQLSLSQYVKKKHNCKFHHSKINWKVNTLPSKNIQTETN